MWWKSLASLTRARRRPDDTVQQAEEVSGAGELGIPIHIVGVGVGPPDYDLLGSLAAGLARTFQVSCHIEDEWIDAAFAYNPARDQYYATAILERIVSRLAGGPQRRILGVSSMDLFVPILTFVFGEAQLQGNCAVVSYHRLTEATYGDPAITAERLIKEATHELGHTFGLRHCQDWNCVMSSSHSVERMDIKSAAFCVNCRKQIRVRCSIESERPP